MAFKNGRKKHEIQARRSIVKQSKKRKQRNFFTPLRIASDEAHRKGRLLNASMKIITPILCLCKTFSKIFLLPSQWFTPSSSNRKIELLEQRVTCLEQEISLLKSRNQDQLLSIPKTDMCLSTALLPPPPPPPLPPPAPLFILPSQQNKTKNMLNVKNISQDLCNNNSESKLITDELLKNIKLRKVIKAIDKHVIEEEIKAPLVNIQDINSVKLKKTVVQKRTPRKTTPSKILSSLSALRVRNANIKKFSGKKSSPGDVIRRHLRKVPIERSPGGTPMASREFNYSMGEGLTPMLSNALKNKFKNANNKAKPSPNTPNFTLQFNSVIFNLHKI